MKWMSLNELRERYLSFFESKGHLRLGSFSLVPNNDKSLLLINLPYKVFTLLIINEELSSSTFLSTR